MKKLLSVLLISLFATTMIFAKTTTPSSDSYADEYTDSYEEAEEEDDKAPFFNFNFSSKQKYVLGDEVTLFTFNAVNQLKQQTATITYNTKNEKFGFGSVYMAAYYIVLMDSKNRDLLKAAYTKYLSDFENKKLNRKDKKSNKAYGKFTTVLNWGTIKASTPSYGTAKATLGYTFINNSPYFLITIPQTFNDYSTDNIAVARESMGLKYAFTKAQMAALIEALSDENINTLIPGKANTVITEDVYNDTDVSEEANTETADTTEESAEIESEEIITEEVEVSVEA